LADYKNGQWSIITGRLKASGKGGGWGVYYRTNSPNDIIIEKTWNGSGWDTDTVVDLEIDALTGASLVIGCGRNDDTMRLYVGEGGYSDQFKLVEITNTDPYVIDTVGIEEREITNDELQMTEIKICPNPFVHSTVVSYSFLVIRKNQRIEIKTYDLGGRLVEKVYLKTNNQQLTTEIGKNLTPGIYFVKLKAGNRVWRKKVTKIR
jgi:hypothetical protein